MHWDQRSMDLDFRNRPLGTNYGWASQCHRTNPLTQIRKTPAFKYS